MTATTRSPRRPASASSAIGILRAYGRYLQQAGIPQSQGFIAAALNRYPDIARGAARAVRRAARSGRRQGRRGHGQAPQGEDQGCAGRRSQHRRRHDHPPLPQPDRGVAAHQPFRPRPAREGPVAGDQARFARWSTACRSRGRGARSSSTAPRSRACICASARWRAAACAGRTARRTTAPRCSAWSRRSRSRTPSSCRSAPRAASIPKRSDGRPAATQIFEAGTQGLHQLRLQPAVDHRQYRRRRGRAAARTSSGATRTIPISSSPPTRARRPSPTPPTRSARSTASGSTTPSRRGGSAGYDHKKMGITAKGAWEAVKRHFREMNRDIQTTPFTVVGVGDMSGDVFGNGMLLSDQTRLIAAFDHRDIFIDPDPDPAASMAERQRMFALPRSSWQDYDKSKLSPGGVIVSRSQKSITLPAAAAAAIGLGKDRRLAGRDHERHPQGAGRPALVRRHRHLCARHRARPTRMSATAPTTRSASPPPKSGPRSSARAPISASPSAPASSSACSAAPAIPTPSTIRAASTAPTSRSTSRSRWPPRCARAR